MIYNCGGCLQVLYFCPIFFSISNTPNKSKWQLVCLPRFFSSFIEKSRGVRECRNSEGTTKSRDAKNSPNHLMGVSRTYTSYSVYKTLFCYVESPYGEIFRKTLYYHFRENTDGRPSIFWEKHHGLVTIRKKCSLSVSQLGLIMVMSPPESTTLFSNVKVILGVL